MIPAGWKEFPLDELCTEIRVGIVVKPTQYYVAPGKGIKAFRSANIKEGKIDDSDWVYISESGHKTNKKSILKEGDVLLVRSGAPGISCVVDKAHAGSNCIDIVFARPNTGRIIPELLCNLNNSSLVKRQVSAMEGGLAIRHLNVGAYSSVVLVIPESLVEQRAIAAVLSSGDEAIMLCEQLIAAKQRRRQALAQRLLTGKARLPGFVKQPGTVPTHPYPLPKDWAYVRIGKVCRELTGRNSDAADLPVLSCTKHQGLVSSLDYFGKRVFSEETSAYKLVPRGTFAYATNHIEEGSIGYQDLYDLALISPIYTVFQTTEQVDDSFLFRLLKTEWYRQLFQKHTNASVDRRGSLRWSHFSEICIPLPSIREQRAIVEVLEDADREIALHRAELDALKRQKRGLMQQLLTGKVRVP